MKNSKTFLVPHHAMAWLLALLISVGLTIGGTSKAQTTSDSTKATVPSDVAKTQYRVKSGDKGVLYAPGEKGVRYAPGSSEVDTTQATPSISAEILVGTGVENREVVGAAESFASTVGKFYCWSRITGASGSTLKHVWLRNGTEMASVDLNVGGSPWRTWSSKTIPTSWTGDWEVRVVDSNGTTIASKTFKVE